MYEKWKMLAFIFSSTHLISYHPVVPRLTKIYIKKLFFLKLKYTTTDAHNRIQFYSSFFALLSRAGF